MSDSHTSSAALLSVLVSAALLLSASLSAAEEFQEKPKDRSFNELIADCQKAVVVIMASNRRGESAGLGSGFVLRSGGGRTDGSRSGGVVVTNHHVIGDGRAFEVQLADGRLVEPTAILAFDRHHDLALIRVDADNLPALELGDSSAAKVGLQVATVGHPLGLRMSVARGVVAGVREFDERSMIQVAMPIEVGNSGSPLFDMQGRVLGVVAIKSGTSLGFAVPSDQVKRLLDHPHPIPIDGWITIGQMDPRRWQTMMGGNWRQRAGGMIASGSGNGFGGRMLCLFQEPPPEGRFEVAVEVKLGDESGAGGLAFHSDSGDRHYGFYPTAGSLRLTCFEGPDVFSWRILETVNTEQYELGEWNEVRVAVDGPHLTCYLNDHKVIEVDDEGLSSGLVGLVKFREPGAEFRRFRLGKTLAASTVSAETAAEIEAVLNRLSPRGEPKSDVLSALAEFEEKGPKFLRGRAREMEKEAARLKHIADLVEQRATELEIAALFSQDHSATEGTAKEETTSAETSDAAVDLLQAALLIARLDNPELNVKAYVEIMNRMAAEVRDRYEDNMTADEKLTVLLKYTFREQGFHGSRSEYYHRSNSYVNEVIEDREGLPIVLSVVFMELARRVGLRVEGLGIPRHFIVRHVPGDGGGQLIDVFNEGKRITLDEAKELSGHSLAEEHLQAASHRAIVIRMLRNLFGVARQEKDVYAMLRYVNVILLLEPTSAYDRWLRAVLRYQTAQPQAAEEDLQWLLENEQSEVDAGQVRELLNRVRRS